VTWAQLRRGIGTAGIISHSRLALVDNFSFFGFDGGFRGGDHLFFEAALELIRLQEPVPVVLKT
jgi:hypothetical protein